MPLILPGNVAAATASTVYSIANSCRFNDGDSPSLEKTSGTPTSGVKGTFSFWFKRGELGTSATKYFISTNDISTPYFQLYIGTSSAQQDSIRVQVFTGGTTTELITSRKFRDPSSWQHCVFSYDSTPSTPSSSSIRLFINGVQETAFSTETYGDQNAGHNFEDGNIMVGAANSGPENFFDGYLAEFVYCDGQAYAASDFGEFDSDSPTIWKPKDVSGLTFGDEGFWLDFEASANLGNDANGGTDLSEVNIAAIDQCLDSPTNNFCTLNPLDNYWQAATFSEGNNKVVTQPGTGLTGSYYTYNTGTFGLTAGKWYFEARVESTAGTYDLVGIAGRSPEAQFHDLGRFADTYGYKGNNGKIQNNATLTTYGDSYGVDGNIVGVYIDLDNNKLYFGKNGTVQNSGTGFSVTDPASVLDSVYYPAAGDQYNSATEGSTTWAMNFGATAFGGTAISSGNADANGYGNFEYDPSSGTFDGASKDFLAICTKNLGSDGG